jgi:hypothetical protein
MTFSISQLATSRFILPEKLLDFVNNKCSKDLYWVENGAPVTNTWHADELIEEYYKNGGIRMTEEEIEKYC